MIFRLILTLYLNVLGSYSFLFEKMTTECMISLAESVPENLTYPPGSPSHLSTYDGIMSLIENAQHTIEIASFYWSLQAQDVYNSSSSWQGENIFKKLIDAGKNRKITIKIVQNQANPRFPNTDTKILVKEASAIVRNLNVQKLMHAGILHTKMWLIDRKHFYVGSNNLDWRSFTQIKEMGAIVSNCSSLSQDMGKLFDVYWYLSKVEKLPRVWPNSYSTNFNKTNPLNVNFNKTNYNTYLSSSPPPFCANGRTGDIDAILDVIYSAKKFIHIAVMDYAPALIYSYPKKYWPVIDNALRNVSFNKGVEVFMMCSLWKHTKPSVDNYLNSLAALSGTGRARIQVKFFHVPSFTPEQDKIPFARVNHDKYMVTDTDAYIGTSNWSGDYFTSTAGLGLIVRPTDTKKVNLRQQLEAVFQRDWNSKYSFPVKRR
ncbi:5'-3' exonuclease PLD3 [Octopus bimaculoides]|uniref:PLD phosphodiesterase domain-containing protein n=1 Tax=Octopus bimaculoides TaxID=37653 RepID=A0A0L8GFK0_OCTBM|nr:5'-3' exonuclease PLD3 [Octopus bimaculoides]|eukprot:XP_014781492.1 PREDICTED: phospholipase D3-like isoform X2 [Octopus bimaculoides]